MGSEEAWAVLRNRERDFQDKTEEIRYGTNG
jgi:hypothetical protein